MIGKMKYIYLTIGSFLQNILKKYDIYYITEIANWSIKDDGKNIKKYLEKKIKIELSYTGYGVRNSLIHYGTEGVFFNSKRIKVPHRSNKVIVTWFHMKDDDPKIKKILEADLYVDLWHTSCEITKNKLIKQGINENKIRLIPLGIDLDIYRPLDKNQIIQKREKLGIPKDYIVIGSFQKDGIGWGEGLEPKMEKGPDVFCDVIEKLSQKYKIFVLLTGPARGYVKNRLNKSNVKFLHRFLENSKDVVNYFQLCDLYIVASRVEGGPKAILESMACGVPIVSTKVGMAPDVIEDQKDGMLCEIENSDEIYEKCRLILDNDKYKDILVKNGLLKVQKYDYNNISKEYLKMYRELM